MNNRAQLVDAWRQIAVTANAWLGVFNVSYNLNTLSPANQTKPLDFAASRTDQQLALTTELPLVRKAERNAYRTTLIQFQRQRRALMLDEDEVLQQVRSELRQLRQLAANYEIQRRSLELAYAQVTLAQETFRAPPVPGEQRDAATAAAALTQQLLNAQQAVPPSPGRPVHRLGDLPDHADGLLS